MRPLPMFFALVLLAPVLFSVLLAAAVVMATLFSTWIVVVIVGWWLFGHRYGYRGPERVIELPADAAAREQKIDAALNDAAEIDGLTAAVVLDASPRLVRARVLAQLKMERKPWWRRIWMYGFAAVGVMAIAAVAIVLWPKPAPRPRWRCSRRLRCSPPVCRSPCGRP